MRYYGPQAYTRPVFIEESVRGLLAIKYGRCGAWAGFFMSVLGSQGIGCAFGDLEARPIDIGGNTVTPIGITVNHVQAQGGDPGVYEFPAPNIHRIIRYGNRVYDPSYGLDFDTLNGWEDAMLKELILPGPVLLPQREGIEDLQWQDE